MRSKTILAAVIASAVGASFAAFADDSGSYGSRSSSGAYNQDRNDRYAQNDDRDHDRGEHRGRAENRDNDRGERDQTAGNQYPNQNNQNNQYSQKAQPGQSTQSNEYPKNDRSAPNNPY